MARINWTRDKAVEYLRHNANWIRVQSDKHTYTDPDTLSTAIVRRYARNAFRINEQESREFTTLAELRGHGAGEHHRERKQKRVPDYFQPSKLPRGRFNQPIAETADSKGAWRTPGHPPRVHAGYVRITSGEGMAKRELVYAARKKQTVYINLLGPQGRYVQMFSKSGYAADQLLTAAGYVEHNGRWALRGRRTAQYPYQGLEEYLLAIVPHMRSRDGSSDLTPLGRIVMYQIIVDEEATPPSKRRKRIAWPATDPRFKAGHEVLSLPTKSTRKARNRAAAARPVRRS